MSNLDDIMNGKWTVSPGQNNYDKTIEICGPDGMRLWVDSDDVGYSGLALAARIVKEHNARVRNKK